MIFNRIIKVEDKVISDASAVFIIAEAGVNHNGDIDIAKQLIDVAVDAGVDAVKFQAFKTKNLIIDGVDKAPYQQKTTGNSESQFEMLKRLEINQDQNRELVRYCKSKNILFLSTPFDEESIDELAEIGIAAYKIASTDTTNLPFLRRVAQKGKPIILSTGMSYLPEVELALNEIYPYNKDVILLQCTANYPIKDEEANLKVVETYKSLFDIIVGYSDHSVGMGASLFSIPMGAKVVEKHFTLSKDEIGPDHRASLSPKELIEYVKEVRKVEKYLGSSIKKPSFAEIKTRQSLQKCLVANTDIKKGEVIQFDMIVGKRTGGIGISPIYYRDIVNKISSKNYKKNDIIDE
jgi:N-acetylneuraminate synthase